MSHYFIFKKNNSLTVYMHIHINTCKHKYTMYNFVGQL